MAKKECDISKIKEIADKVRDAINLIQVYNTVEEEGEGKKIEDDAANDLKAKLQEIAKKLSEIC